MIVLADRNFRRPALAGRGRRHRRRSAGPGQDRAQTPGLSPTGRWQLCLPHGPIEVRVITATITVTTDTSQRSQTYRLITTVLDQACPPGEIVALYHQRWEIETAFFELKSSILDGRVLRARTPPGIAQEIYALLITHQAIRLAIMTPC
jgi:IS4 transposase